MNAFNKLLKSRVSSFISQKLYNLLSCFVACCLESGLRDRDTAQAENGQLVAYILTQEPAEESSVMFILLHTHLYVWSFHWVIIVGSIITFELVQDNTTPLKSVV